MERLFFAGRQRSLTGRPIGHCYNSAFQTFTRESRVMFTLSAFADEISPDPQEQIDVLKKCGIRHIELRSILKTNVLDLSELQVSELKALLDKNGFQLSAIGS